MNDADQYTCNSAVFFILNYKISLNSSVVEYGLPVECKLLFE